MAKGTLSKDKVKEKILEVFEGSFINDKEIRIPFVENGEPIEIKVTLTCAKEVIGAGTPVSTSVEATVSAFPTPAAPAQKVEATEEEKQRLKELVARMF